MTQSRLYKSNLYKYINQSTIRRLLIIVQIIFACLTIIILTPTINVHTANSRPNPIKITTQTKRSKFPKRTSVQSQPQSQSTDETSADQPLNQQSQTLPISFLKGKWNVALHFPEETIEWDIIALAQGEPEGGRGDMDEVMSIELIEVDGQLVMVGNEDAHIKIEDDVITLLIPDQSGVVFYIEGRPDGNTANTATINCQAQVRFAGYVIAKGTAIATK